MHVHAVSTRQRGVVVRITAVVVFAAIAAHPRPVFGQQPAANIPATHTVKRGDTLWEIARMYLGDPFLWPEVYRLNTDQIEDPHWIYPGEVLKLPAPARVIAVTPPPAAAPQPTTPTLTPAIPVVVAPDTTPQPMVIVAASSVRAGEFAAAPWVEQRGGPRGYGSIIQIGELPGIASHEQPKMQLYDRVMISPPEATTPAARTRYLAYKLGPFIQDFGQIVIPTGVIEVVRSPKVGEATVARVVRMFTEVEQDQRLLPFDSTMGIVAGAPRPVENGRIGQVRWIYNEPVLPSLQNYVVVDLKNDGAVNTGDQIDFYLPTQKATENRSLAIPEIYIGRAQVLRVTPYGASAIIIGQEQPKIEDRTAVRVSAKMP